jgi:phosphoribosylformimino-5-aminoimidazole carboxamide ribotide isomerase
LPVIAAGGVTDLEDIKALFPLASKGLVGVITGKAIYSHSLDLKEALNWVEAEKGRMAREVI